MVATERDGRLTRIAPGCETRGHPHHRPAHRNAFTWEESMMPRVMAAGIAVVIGGALIGSLAIARPDADERCPDGRELVLVNGRIHTMDASDRVVSSVAIRNGRFASVGHDRAGSAGDPRCQQVIDLENRLVIPGLVDN